MKRVSELYYEEIGADFDRFMSAYDVSRRIELMNDLLPPGRRFVRGLEVGCGTGAISRAFRPRLEALMVTDISAKLAEQVGKELGCEHRAEDACHLSLPDRSFDLVFSSECVEHTPRPLDAVAELARVVAPGGVLLLTTPNRLWQPVVKLASALHLRKFQGNELFVTAKAVCEVLSRSGLTVLKVSGCHLFPWQLPLAKRVLPLFDDFGERLHPVMINFGVVAERR